MFLGGHSSPGKIQTFWSVGWLLAAFDDGVLHASGMQRCQLAALLRVLNAISEQLDGHCDGAFCASAAAELKGPGLCAAKQKPF